MFTKFYTSEKSLRAELKSAYDTTAENKAMKAKVVARLTKRLNEEDMRELARIVKADKANKVLIESLETRLSRNGKKPLAVIRQLAMEGK